MDTSDISVCQLTSIAGRLVTTRCGQTTSLAHATVWGSLVTCRACLAGTKLTSEADEYAASVDALIASS